LLKADSNAHHALVAIRYRDYKTFKKPIKIGNDSGSECSYCTCSAFIAVPLFYVYLIDKRVEQIL